MSLADIIRQRIKKEGPLSFCDFMEMALYYPELGYYTSDREKIGMHGDYYTSVTLTPAFGAMIARQIEEMWHITGEKTFTILEYGAGNGLLCHDILSYFNTHTSRCNNLFYGIIEKNGSMSERAKRYLPHNVTCYNNIQEVGSIAAGCIISNELVDNFSVHRVVMEDQLMEVFVDDINGFTEILKPAGEPLTDYMASLDIQLSKGYCTEINLEATKWIKEMAAVLQQGYILTIDYGEHSAELYRSSRSNGTVLCYHRHVLNENPYSHIGEQDITAHVNFSALRYWGEKYGLTCSGITNQANFLLSLGFKEYLRKTLSAGQGIARAAIREAYITRALLLEMGSKFKVLIQQKGVPSRQLKGLEGEIG